MSARPKPVETLGLSLARLCAALRSAYDYKDALKEYRPTLEKVFKWTHASRPAVRLLLTLSTPTLVQAADMALRVRERRVWKREFILHLFQAWAYTL